MPRLTPRAPRDHLASVSVEYLRIHGINLFNFPLTCSLAYRKRARGRPLSLTSHKPRLGRSQIQRHSGAEDGTRGALDIPYHCPSPHQNPRPCYHFWYGVEPRLVGLVLELILCKAVCSFQGLPSYALNSVCSRNFKCSFDLLLMVL